MSCLETARPVASRQLRGILKGDAMLDQIKGDKTSFHLEEATIADLHEAIGAGKTTLVEVVQRYIDRARAYTGTACLLLTEDGASVPEANGAVRAKAPLRSPIETV